jgi:hypothetical protein
LVWWLAFPILSVGADTNVPAAPPDEYAPMGCSLTQKACSAYAAQIGSG